MLEWWGNHKKDSPSQFLQKSAVCHSVISHTPYNKGAWTPPPCMVADHSCSNGLRTISSPIAWANSTTRANPVGAMPFSSRKYTE